jgi:hypothetical protein
VIARVHDGGRHMPGLVSYLTGPGKANEHTDQRIVAGSGTLAEEFAGQDWDGQKNIELARILDGAWRQLRREKGLPLYAGADDAARGPARAEHVFHVSLSLGPDGGTLTDEQWGQIAREYVDAMEFAGPQTAAAGRAECQWVAVHHGQTKSGGDHIHLAVCLVREDGTRASVHKSYARSRTVTDGIEARHGLPRVKDRALERGLPGYDKAEAARAQREGAPEVASLQLARRLRAAAAVSTSEADYVRNGRLAGVLVRPRFAAATTDVVSGYSVALRPADGSKPLWRAPSKLDRNLGLGALRGRWGTDVTGADAAGRAAVAVWRGRDVGDASLRGAAASARRVPMRALPPETAQQLAALTAQLSKVDAGDRAGWAAAAREASYVFARWSVQVEGARPGPLARASDTLARSAQPDKDERGPRPAPGLMARHVALMARATSSNPASGWLAVMTQLDRLTQAVQDAHAAREELAAVTRMRTATGVDLTPVRRELVTAGERAAAAPAPTAEPAPAVTVEVDPAAEGDPQTTAAREAQRAAALHFPDSVTQQFARPRTPGGPARPSTPSAPSRERAKESDLER